MRVRIKLSAPTPHLNTHTTILKASFYRLGELTSCYLAWLVFVFVSLFPSLFGAGCGNVIYMYLASMNFVVVAVMFVWSFGTIKYI